MAPRLLSARAQWDWAASYGHDGNAWVEILEGREDDFIRLSSSFDPRTYLGRGTVLQRDIRSMPIAAASDAMASYMSEASPFSPNGAWGSKTSLNTSAYGTQPIHMYVVDSTHPRAVSQIWNATAIETPPLEVETYMRGPVPMADWMVPAQNGDRGLAIYDTGTGIMRELFMAQKNSSGQWTGGGGYSVAQPGLRNLAADNYALQQRRGLSNVAGMHNSLGFIGIGEALRGEITHALCFTASALRMRRDDGPTPLEGSPLISWPSRGSDGKLENYLPGGPQHAQGKVWNGGTITPTHGQWGRLKAEVDPDHNPRTGKPYPRFLRMIIRAAKTYGLVATDTNLWCHAFNAEQGRVWKHVYGMDPWATGGIIEQLYRDRYGNSEMAIHEFPWHMTEWAPIDWGRPSPDMNLRPGQIAPWFRDRPRPGWARAPDRG
ncbi:hypothetical protein [Brachybacterium hainanense]|uniref:Uncharacterized protein n=1 Tax=Brachybacterium hainanense TaxID=1541174 RepID=A0ABV6RCH3_9MICO